MSYIELILIISLASLGVRAITDKGKIFYFLRKPIDDLQDEAKDMLKKLKEIKRRIDYCKSQHEHWRNYGDEAEAQKHYDNLLDIRAEYDKRHPFINSRLKYIRAIDYLAKPLLTCSTCMASFWSVVLFPILEGGYNYRIFVVALGVAFLNTLLWALTQLITKSLK